MAELTLISSHNGSLRSLVETALQTQLRVLQAGIQRTEARLRDFEVEHKMSTAEFLASYGADGVSETLATIDWVGESRMLDRLREKEQMLKDIQVVD